MTSLDVEARVATLSNKDEVALREGAARDGLERADPARRRRASWTASTTCARSRNSDALREELEQAERVALIGGSYIGTELAASFTALGKQCELIMLEAVTHERFYGPEVGRFFQDVLTEHGVKVHGSQELERFEGAGDRVRTSRDEVGARDRVRLRRDRRGRHPDIPLAEQAGLETDSGVLTDRYLETSAPGVFAAGDIAEYDSVVHGRRLRIEHWDVAFNQGKYAALNMLGKQQEYDVVPYFWSDLADWTSMEYVGPASDWDEIWWRGSIGGRQVHRLVREGRPRRGAR